MKRSDLLADLIVLVHDLKTHALDPDCRSEGQDDDTPTLQLTIGADASGWNYQTGDTSFTGGAYGFAHWGIAYITADSEPADVAQTLIDDLEDQTEEHIFAPEDEVQISKVS